MQEICPIFVGLFNVMFLFEILFTSGAVTQGIVNFFDKNNYSPKTTLISKIFWID